MYNTVNETYFDIIDTEDKAYLLGFFIADGCIIKGKYNYRFSINLSDIDVKILECYSNNICNNTIVKSNYKVGAINRKPTCMLRWTSRHMAEIFINKYNIKPNKTNHNDFVFDFNYIPNDLIRHFIRGYFDGDGHISFGNNQFTFAIYGTSKNFLKQIGYYISQIYSVEIIINNYKKESIIKLYSLRFNSFYKRKFFIKELYNYLYLDTNIYLDRKKNKFENYLNTVLT